ncbi:hypothetical protein Scep_023094 [Stephania cephalantha]|uniref:Terpene cyclase/mutase family member n=1 Tax=Stephania cephalantha TaxID=152367 RepID=A0AAP0EUH4_9MAGN
MWKLKFGEESCTTGPFNSYLFSTNNFVGRQTWEFDPDAGTPEERAEVEKARQDFQTNRFNIKPCGDVLLRLQMLKENKGKYDLKIPAVKIGENEEVSHEKVSTALRRGVRFFCALQTRCGHWAADIGGPLFFMPPLVFVLYISGTLNTIFSSEHKKEILRYMYNHQNEDGGWGFHIEGKSTMFGTAFNYICMRLLGEGPDGGQDDACSRGRKWIQDRGGVTFIPSWGKACENVVLLPLGVHAIVILIWKEEDLYFRRSPIQNLIWDCLNAVEPLLGSWPFSKCREKALQVAMEHVHYEDEASRYITIGSVEKVLCMLACWVEDPNGTAFKRHLARVQDYLWMAEDGMRMQSFGSQQWDTGFALQALLSTNLIEEVGEALKRGHFYVKESQVKDNPPGDFRKMYRHISKGGWTFSDQDQGWQVSDCTAEGLTCCLSLSLLPPEIVGEKMEDERLYDSVNLLLSLQGKDGGLPAWEPVVGAEWMEALNPTEFFDKIILESEYPECTASAIQALVLFKKLHPRHRKKEIQAFIAKAVAYLQQTQRPDGSWYGNWGVCFIYGTWFGLRGLSATGKNCVNCPTVRKACDFLLSKQLASGGWGESFRSCPEQKFVFLENKKATLVHTAWALLGLMSGGQAERDPEPLQRGVKVLINNQMENGDFPQEEITGAFVKNCALHYAAYRNVFPLWALGEYRQRLAAAAAAPS